MGTKRNGTRARTLRVIGAVVILLAILGTVKIVRHRDDDLRETPRVLTSVEGVRQRTEAMRFLPEAASDDDGVAVETRVLDATIADDPHRARLTVLSSSGKPVPFVTLVFGGTLNPKPISRRSDAAGTVGVPLDVSGEDVWVFGDQVAPELTSISPDGSTVRLTRVGTTTIDVKIEGETDLGDVTFRARPSNLFFPSPGEVALEMLDRLGAGPNRWDLRSIAPGQTLLENLPKGQMMLRTPDGLHFSGKDTRIASFEFGRDDTIEIRLVRDLHVEGQVVWSDGNAARGVPLVATVARRSDGRLVRLQQTSGDDGRFDFSIDCGSCDTIVIEAYETTAFRRDEVFEESLDVGRLVIGTRRRVDIFATDEDGVGIPRPAAYCEHYLNLEAVGDVDGHVVLDDLPSTVTSVVVGRCGFEAKTLELLPSQDHYSLELERCPSVRIFVRDELSRPVVGATVRVRSDEDLFLSRNRIERADVLTGASSVGMMMTGKTTSCLYGADSSGTVALSSLRPDAAFFVDVVGSRHVPIVVATLGPFRISGTEEKAIEIVVERSRVTSRCLRGIVRSGTMPLANARVALAVQGSGFTFGTETDDSGRFAFDGLVGSEVELVVNARGFESVELQGVAIPEGGKPLEIHLEPGRVVAVSIEMPDGTPMFARVWATTAEGYRIAGQRRDEGMEIRSLPRRAGTVATSICGVTYSCDVGESETGVVIRVPFHAAANIRWTRESNEGLKHRIRLALSGGSEHSFELSIEDVKTKSASLSPIPIGRHSWVVETFDDDEWHELERGTVTVDI